VESPTDQNDMNELDQYVFVARAHIGQYHPLRSVFDSLTTKADRKTQEASHFIDIKSIELKDILRTILQGVPGISLKGDKLSVRNLDYATSNPGREDS
jgi:hypothetical protein